MMAKLSAFPYLANLNSQSIPTRYIVTELFFSDVYNSPPEDFLDGFEAAIGIMVAVIDLKDREVIGYSSSGTKLNSGGDNNIVVTTGDVDASKIAKKATPEIPKVLGTDALCESIIYAVENLVSEYDEFYEKIMEDYNKVSPDADSDEEKTSFLAWKQRIQDSISMVKKLDVHVLKKMINFLHDYLGTTDAKLRLGKLGFIISIFDVALAQIEF